MRILHSYILKQHLVPFVLGFGVVTFILEMDVLFDYLDLVVNRGVAAHVVAQLFLLSLGYIIALSVPCAVLVAALMTFGRLSQDNEITALRASGVNMLGIVSVPVGAAVLLSIGLTLFNNHVLPESNHAFANLLIDIGRMRPTVKLQEGVFITDFPGYNMLVQSVNGRTNEMRGVTIYQLNPGAPPTTIIADRGFLSYTPDGRNAIIELSDGEIHEIPAPEADTNEAVASRYRRMVFKKHTIHIVGAGGMLERTVRDARSDREMSARGLMDERAKMIEQYDTAATDRRMRFAMLGVPEDALGLLTPERLPLKDRLLGWIARIAGRPGPLERLSLPNPSIQPEVDMWRSERESYRKRIAGLSVEIHKKFSLPAACVVFILIGAPIGMRVRRAGPAVAFVSIAFFLFYYLCLVGGEELANRLLLEPWLSMWLPNIVLGAWGLFSTLEACDVRLGRPRPRQALAPSA